MNAVRRAAEHHEVMAHLEDSPWETGKRRGTLAVIQAAKPKPIRVKKPKQTRWMRSKAAPRTKKQLEAKLDDLNRELVFWLYSNTCVEKALDGANCGGGLELGHIIRRSDSAWLKRLYWNLCVQCHDHNVFHGDPQLHTVIGPEHMARLRAEMVAHRSQAPSAEELQRRIERVEYLLANKPTTWTPDTLKAMGYFG